jgi:hypothetical protein
MLARLFYPDVDYILKGTREANASGHESVVPPTRLPLLDAACKSCYNLSILLEAQASAAPNYHIQLDRLPHPYLGL